MFSNSKLSQNQVNAILKAARKGMDDPSYLSGLEGAGPVQELEDAMTKYLDADHVLAVSSGTAAIHTALLTCGIGPGDEVIVSPYSWGQSVSPVLFTGATPVFADILEDTLCIDPESVKKKITEKTKAIIPVHIFGRLADIDAIKGMVKDKGITVISDSAHAMGLGGQRAFETMWGDVACFSLGRGKLVCGGEGGLIATNNDALFEKAVCLTQHSNRVKREAGLHSTFDLHDLAYNYRIHPFAAVIAREDLRTADSRLSHRKEIWSCIYKKISACRNKIVELYKPPYFNNWAAYGIPLVFNGNPIGYRELVSKCQSEKIPLRPGPVEKCLNFKVKDAYEILGQNNCSLHEKEACPVAERHARNKELWLLSPLDMDEMDIVQADEMADRFKNILDEMTFTVSFEKISERTDSLGIGHG